MAASANVASSTFQIDIVEYFSIVHVHPVLKTFLDSMKIDFTV